MACQSPSAALGAAALAACLTGRVHELCFQSGWMRLVQRCLPATDALCVGSSCQVLPAADMHVTADMAGLPPVVEKLTCTWGGCASIRCRRPAAHQSRRQIRLKPRAGGRAVAYQVPRGMLDSVSSQNPPQVH